MIKSDASFLFRINFNIFAEPIIRKKDMLLLFAMLPSGSEWLIIALVILLLFGGKKIPELMKGLGKGVKSFKEGVNDVKKELNEDETDEKK